MADIHVRSWNELIDQLYANSWKPWLGRFRSSFAFRGTATIAHDLTTGLSRLGGRSERIEGHLLRNFRKYAIQEGDIGGSVWKWLALAQHHGLPTRLLDWTYSPFVAMHFATARHYLGHDAAIWCVDFNSTKRLLPRRLRTLLEQEGSDVFTVEMLESAAPTLANFDALARRPFVVFLEPPSIDARIVNQSALFSLLSSPSAGLETWLKGHPESWRRIVIPGGLRREIRDKLDQANVTERVLFPGLDGLSAWLRRYYEPGCDELRPEEDGMALSGHEGPLAPPPNAPTAPLRRQVTRTAAQPRRRRTARALR